MLTKEISIVIVGQILPLVLIGYNENQHVGIGKDGLGDWAWCFVRQEVIGLVSKNEFDMGWREEDKRVFGEEGLVLRRVDREWGGKNGFLWEEREQRGSQMLQHEEEGERDRKIMVLLYLLFLFSNLGWFGFACVGLVGWIWMRLRSIIHGKLISYKGFGFYTWSSSKWSYMVNYPPFVNVVSLVGKK